jgi:hypothetical protein
MHTYDVYTERVVPDPPKLGQQRRLLDVLIPLLQRAEVNANGEEPSHCT